MARVLGHQIVAALSVIPSIPREPLELGDTQLLRFDRFKAIQYWQGKRILDYRNTLLGYLATDELSR